MPQAARSVGSGANIVSAARARRPGRRPDGYQGAGEAERCSKPSICSARLDGVLDLLGAAHRSAAPVAQDRRAHQRQAWTRASASICCASNSSRSRRSWAKAKRQRGRNRGTQKGHRRCADAGRSGKTGDQGTETPGADVGCLRRILDGAQLSRLADRAAVENARDRRRSTSPRRNASWARTISAWRR